LFSKLYKNANKCIDSSGAYERVKEKITNPHRNSMSRTIISVAACFTVVVIGFSAYQIIKPGVDEDIALVNENMRKAPDDSHILADYAQEGSLSADISITEESMESYSKIESDPMYSKRTVKNIEIYEKEENNQYECWLKKEGTVKKIVATDISPEEKENLIRSILQ